jgi:FkbM family methyltransferase
MIVLCGGMIRSGSTLQFQIAHQLLAPRKLARRWTYLEPDKLEARLRRLPAHRASGLIKTHVLTPSAIALLQQRRAKALYCFRDLRDVALSGMRAFGYDWARFKSDRLLEAAVEAEAHWRMQPGLLVQRYAHLRNELPAAVAEIAQHLGIRPELGEVEKIAERLRLERQRSPKRWKPAPFDSSKHIHHGEIGGWQRELAPEIAAEITTRFSEWLTSHGYSLISLPEVPAGADEECLVPHVGWLTFGRGDAVMTGVRDGDFEFAEQAFFHRVLRPGDSFIDCGAHSGMFAKLAASHVVPGGCVHAIEPSPPSFARLQRNTADLPAGLCTLHPIALGGKEGKVRLVALEGGMAAYNHLATCDETSGIVEVPQLTLPAFLRQVGLSKVDFVKIDTEGQELAILKAAAPLLRREAIRVLMVEFNQQNLARYGASCHNLAGLLTGHGYKLLTLDRSQFRLVPARPSDTEGYANYFAVKNVAWLQRRFAEAAPAAQKISADLIARGAQVQFQRRRLLAISTEQAAYIGSLRAEQQCLEQTLQQTVQAAQAGSAELQAHVDSLRAQLAETAATNQRTIDSLRAQLDQATADHQATVDALRAKLDQLAATSQEQSGYVAVLEKERDRLAAEAARLAADSAHYVTVMNEQTAYIGVLERERGQHSPPSGA